MSLASKITLGVATLASIGIIYYVQAKQQDDIRKMHEGVIRDKERQKRKKIENIYYLEQQAELTKQLRKSADEEAVLKILEAQKDGKK